jgi:hypothetical protein
MTNALLKTKKKAICVNKSTKKESNRCSVSKYQKRGKVKAAPEKGKGHIRRTK